MNKILRKIRLKNNKRRHSFIEPDEIFLDSKNLPDFDTQQFEGQLEKPISRSSLFLIGVVFLSIAIVFSVRLWYLQIKNGDTYLAQSKNNSLSIEPIFAPRGNIYDRNGVPLVWNNAGTDDTPWGKRVYIPQNGFAHILGYVNYPAKDSSGNFWQKEIIGKDGVEKIYNKDLSGINGSDIVEKDISGKKQTGSIVNQPIAGKNITLSIDARLQSKLNEILVDYIKRTEFRSGSAVMIDVRNGEIIALTNYPEYNPNIMSDATDTQTIRRYLTDKNIPLLNRAVSGLFVPGSIVKPYIALEALKENVVTPFTKICSCGSITVPNLYDPAHPGVFRDFHANNGWVDIAHALAVSSNIYFMEVTGGYKGQKGIGITNLGKALSRFGLTDKTGIDLPGEKSGIVPSPEWKAQKFNGEGWRVGDTYNTAIGQYGVQVTPMEMVRSITAIARRGVLVTPHVIKDVTTKEIKITDIPDEEYDVVHEGLRLGATIGTGKIFGSLPFTSGSKTGTAQVGKLGTYNNSWVNVFFPYENPHYALVVMTEYGAQNVGTTGHVSYEFLRWVQENAPEYTQ